MKEETLKICISDVVLVTDEVVKMSEVKEVFPTPYIVWSTDCVFNFNPTSTWAPIMARAPSRSDSTLKITEWQFT